MCYHSPPKQELALNPVTADKYDCVQALKFASGNWLLPRENQADDLNDSCCRGVSLPDIEAFKEITKALILNYSGPYLALSCEEVESAMTLRVFCCNSYR